MDKAELWALDTVLCSCERSWEDTGSNEEIGAFLSTGDGEVDREREGDGDLPNGEDGCKPDGGLLGEGGDFATLRRSERGLMSCGSSSNSALLLGLGIGTQKA